MAFNINAQVVLSGPKNIKTVRSNIKKQLSGITTNVKVDLSKAANTNLSNLNKQLKTTNSILKQVASSATTANKQISSLSKAANSASASTTNLSNKNKNLSNSFSNITKSAAQSRGEIENFGRDAALAIRRFSAFTIATGAVFGFVRAVKEGVKESIEFERQLSRVVQVTGASAKQIKGLESTIDGLAGTLGLNSNELAKTSVTLAQTGQSIDQVRKSLTAISRASLAPTFGDIKDTTEGVIAALNQFNIGADRTEAVLGSLNAVSKRFAVESEDLISVIRRAGGVFATAAGDIAEPEKALSELVGLFTAVRSTTRESADTIATGLRTIFARIQRKGTIDFLKNFNIELTNAQGQFVGFFEGFRRISEGLKDIQARGDTITLGRIVEELGGIRQIGKLLPVLQNFEKAQEAYNVALKGTDSISKDVAIATQTLSVQFQQLQARFQTLIKDISQSTTFQRLASFALSTANAFITLADALKPVIPLLTTFATIKIGGAALEFAKGFVGGIKKGGGAGGVGKGLSGAITGQGGGGGQLNLKPLQTALTANTNSVNTNTSSVNQNTNSSTTLNTSIKALTTAISRSSLTGGGGTTLGRRRRALGGSIPRFQKGGFVNGPGHAQGGVIAELEGGEFVVPKKQVQKFTNGGGKKPVAAARRGRLKQLEIKEADLTTPFGVTFLDKAPTELSGTIKGVFKDSNNTGANKFAKSIVDYAVQQNFAKPETPKTVKEAKKLVKDGSRITATRATVGTFNPEGKGREVFENDVEAKLPKIVNDAADSFFEKSSIPFDPANFTINELFSNSAIGSIQGQYFEAFTRAVLNSPQIRKDGDKTDTIFDFETAPPKTELLFTAFGEPNEFKNTGTNENINSAIGKGITLDPSGKGIDLRAGKIIPPPTKIKTKATGRNTGGSVETANSLLTPGEAVFGAKKAAQIGINNLTRLNKTGDASGLNISNSDFSIVPGSGNSDTVPASLEPGSFVIKKSSTQEGLQTFNSGGQVQRLKRGGRLERFQGGGSKGGGLGGNLTQLALFASFADLGESANQLITLFFGLETALGLFGKDLSDLGKGLKKQTRQTKKLTQQTQKNIKDARARTNKGLPNSVFAPRGIKVRANSKFGQKRRREAVEAAGKGRLLKRGQALGSRGRFTGARALSSVGRGVGKIAGKGGLVAIVASLLIDPITQAIKDGFGEVELETGQKGFRGEDGFGTGLQKAQVIGAASGAVSGGLAGAGLGGLLGGPAGVVLGGIGGAIIGGIQGYFDATSAQLKFEAFDKFNNVAAASAKVFEEFNKNAKSSSLQKLNKASTDLITSFSTLRRESKAAESLSFKNQILPVGLVEFGNSFSAATGIFEKSVTVIAGAAEYFPKTFAILESFAPEFGSYVKDFGEKIKERGRIQDAGRRFGEAFQAIRPKIEAAANANKKAVELVFKAIPIDELKDFDFKGTESLDELNKQLQTFGVNAKISSDLLSNFKEILKLEGIDNALKDLQSSVSPDNFVKASAQFNGIFSQVVATVEENGGDVAAAIEKVTDSLDARTLNSIGVSAETARRILVNFGKTLTDEALAAVIKYQEKQVELSRILSETTRQVDAFGAALNLLSGGIAGLSSDFSILLGNIQSGLDASLNNDFTVRRQETPNVFENVVGRLPTEINNAVNNLGKILNTDVLDGAAEIVNLQNDLPTALKKTVENLQTRTSSGKIEGAGDFISNEILTEFESNIANFGNLPDFIQENLRATLGGLIEGSRQDGPGGKGALSLEDLLKEGNFDQLNQISAEFTESLSEIQSAVNDFQNAIAQGANNIKKINNLRLRTDLQINTKRQSFEDRFSQFLNQSVDERAKAEKRLRDTIDTQLRAGTGGPGIAAGGIDAGALAARRQRLLDQRDRLQSQLDSPQGLDQAEFDSLTKALGDNASQLDGVTAALKTLSEDVTQLEAVEGELAKIQESRLTGRQRAQLFASRAQDASTPAEFAKLFQDFLAPTIGVAKAQQGGPISFGDAAAILGDPQQIKDVFGFDDAQIESILAGTTQGIGDTFANLLASFGVGSNAAPIARGLFGAGATEAGSTAKEQELLAEAARLQLEREQALLALRDQNITSAETLQQQFSDLIGTTSQSLSDLITRAEQFRTSASQPLSIPAPEIIGNEVSGLLDSSASNLDTASVNLNSATVKLENAVSNIGLSDKEVGFREGIDKEIGPKDTDTGADRATKSVVSSVLKGIIRAAFSSSSFFSKGGGVQYRENGGSIFEPKGTDTVPAMLTPGEYVVNAKAVKKGSNLQLLKDINDGKVTIPKFAKGGLVQYFGNGSNGKVEELNDSFVKFYGNIIESNLSPGAGSSSDRSVPSNEERIESAQKFQNQRFGVQPTISEAFNEGSRSFSRSLGTNVVTKSSDAFEAFKSIDAATNAGIVGSIQALLPSKDAPIRNAPSGIKNFYDNQDKLNSGRKGSGSRDREKGKRSFKTNGVPTEFFSEDIISSFVGRNQGSDLSIDQIRESQDDNLIGRKIAAAKASGFLTRKNLGVEGDENFDLEKELSKLNLEEINNKQAKDRTTLEGIIARTDPNKNFLPDPKRFVGPPRRPKNIVKTDITGKPLSEQSDEEREFDKLIQRRIAEEQKTGKSASSGSTQQERLEAAKKRNEAFFANKKKLDTTKTKNTSKFGEIGQSFGEAAPFLENVQSGRISGLAPLIPSLPRSQFSNDEKYQDYRQKLREEKFGNESGRLEAQFNAQQKTKPQIKQIQKDIAKTIPGSTRRKELEKQLSELENPKISSKKQASPRSKQGSITKGKPERSKVSTINGKAITDKSGKVISPIKDSPFINKPTTLTSDELAAKREAFLSTRPKSKSKTKPETALATQSQSKAELLPEREKIEYDEFGNEITQNPSQELKAARQRQKELRAAQLFFSQKDAQTGKLFEAKAGGTNIDPTTGKPITKERAEEIKNRENFDGRDPSRSVPVNFQTLVRDATDKRNNLERSEGQTYAEERRKREQQARERNKEIKRQQQPQSQAPSSGSKVDQPTQLTAPPQRKITRERIEQTKGFDFKAATRRAIDADERAKAEKRLRDTNAPEGSNRLLDTKYSAPGLENVDPVTLAGGQAQFADQQARSTAVRQRQRNAPASIPTDLPATLGLPPQQEPATNLQQQENLRSRQARIRRTQGEGAASRFGQTFGLRNSGPGQRAGLPGGQGQGQAGAQDFTAFSDSVAKLQETTKSLTAFATQLNTAADKLAQLQTIEVSLNARVEPIQVILNGASIINEFGDTAKKEIYNQLVTKLEDEFVKKTPDGSINEPTLG